MPNQERNSDLMNFIRGEFQARYEPNFAWKSAISLYQALPGLRGFWPMSSVAFGNPQGLDLSANGLHLTNNGSADFGYENLAPYVEFNGTTQYLSRADGGAGNAFDIRGSEAYIVTAQRGLTIYSWVKFDDETPASAEIIAGKNDGAGLAYDIIRRTNGIIRFRIDGGAGTINVDSTTAVGAGVWTLVGGRYIPSTSTSVYVNGTRENDTVAAIPATIQDTTAPFTVGASGVPNLYLDGKESMVALCAAQHSDTIVKAAYNQTRALYDGV